MYPIVDPVIWQQSSSLKSPYSENDYHSTESVINWLSKEVIPKTYNKFWVLQMILTPRWQEVVGGIISSEYDGLASWTSKNAVWEFTDFIQSQTRSLNIIIIDYLSFYPLVTWAIKKNAE